MNIKYLRYALMAFVVSCCFVVEGQASEDTMEIVGPEIVHTNPASRKRSLESNQDHETSEEPSTKRQKANSLSSQEESDDAVGDCNSNIPDAMDVEDEPMNMDSAVRGKKKVIRNIPKHWVQLKETIGEEVVIRRAALLASRIPGEIERVQDKVKWCCENFSKLKLEYRCIEFLATIVKWGNYDSVRHILNNLHDRKLINESQHDIFMSSKTKDCFKDKLKSAILKKLTREELSEKFGMTASVLYPPLNFHTNMFVRYLTTFFKQDFVNRHCQYLFNPRPHKGKEGRPVIALIRDFMNDSDNHLPDGYGYRVVVRQNGAPRDPNDGSLQEAFLKKYGHLIKTGDISASTFRSSVARLMKKGELNEDAIRFYESCKSAGGRPMSIKKWQKLQRKLKRNG